MKNKMGWKGIEEEMLEPIVRQNMINVLYICIFVLLVEGIMIANYFLFRDWLREDYGICYLFCYIVYFILAGITALIIKKYKGKTNLSKKEVYYLQRVIYLFIFLSILWGGAVAILDQKGYGQIAAFMIPYVTYSMLLIIPTEEWIKLESIPLILLFAVLPLVQENTTILVGNYTHLLILGAAVTCGNARSYISFKENYHQQEMITQLSNRDYLTGLFNRRKLQDYVDRVVTPEQCRLSSLAVLMLDIDYFKKYNDTYGHLLGDAVIQEVGKILLEVESRYKVFCARYGGEEFIIIGENKQIEEVRALVTEIQEGLSSAAITHERSRAAKVVTVSIGARFITHSLQSMSLRKVIDEADDVLYEAKRAGRNRYCERIDEA